MDAFAKTGVLPKGAKVLDYLHQDLRERWKLTGGKLVAQNPDGTPILSKDPKGGPLTLKEDILSFIKDNAWQFKDTKGASLEIAGQPLGQFDRTDPHQFGKNVETIANRPL
jgi:hypothetical protein